MKAEQISRYGACFASLAFFSVLALAQMQQGPTQPEKMSDSFKLLKGVVVDEAVMSQEAKQAGLMKGDILLAWFRGEAQGILESPFRLSDVELEQSPRGAVSLEGFRGTEKRTWTLAPGHWGIRARPNFEGPLLTLYGQGKELAEAGKLGDAALRWQAAASQIQSYLPELRSWFLVRAGDQLDAGQRWKEADDAYQAAVQQASSANPLVEGHVLLAWAKSYKQRADLVSADKYYQRSILEMQKAGRELTIASILHDLVDVLWHRSNSGKAEEYARLELSIQQRLAPGSLEVATGLVDVGDAERNRGGLKEAEEDYHQALVIQKRLAPLSIDAAVTFCALELVAWERGELDKAEEYYHEALAIQRQLPAGSSEAARIFAELATVASGRGDFGKADEYYRRELELLQKSAPQSFEVAQSLNNLGILAWQRGDLGSAKEYYDQGLRIEKKLVPGNFAVAWSLNNLGTISWQLGELAKAESYQRQALAIEQKLDPRSNYVAASFTGLGLIMSARGDLGRAEEYHNRALDIVQKLDPGSGSVATIFNNLCLATLQHGDLVKADEYCRKALRILERVAPESRTLALTLNNLASIALARGDPEEAEKYSRRELQIKQKRAPEDLYVASTFKNLGDIARNRGDLGKAEEYYRRTLEIRQKLAPGTADHTEALAELAGVLQRTRRRDQALGLYQQALAALEQQMAKFGGTENARANFRARHIQFYKNYIDLLMLDKKASLAFEVVERSRAQSFLESLNAGHIDIHSGVPPNLLDQERYLMAEIRAKFGRRIQMLSANRPVTDVATTDNEISVLLGKYNDVEGQIRISSPGYAALTQPQPVGLKEAQGLLDSHTVLLEYDLGRQRSYLFALSSGSFEAYRLPGRSLIETEARRLYDLVTSPQKTVVDESAAQRQSRLAKLQNAYAVTAARLSQLVLGPVAARLHNKRLLIVADGGLFYVPFSALPVPGNSDVPLVAEHEIINLPSASVLAVLRQHDAQRQGPSRRIAVLADPVFDAQDSRVEATQEKSAISNAEASLAFRGLNPAASDNEATMSYTQVKPPGAGVEARQTDDEQADQIPDNSLTTRDLARSVADLHLEGEGAVYLPRLQFSRREAASILAVTPAGEVMQALDFDASRATAIGDHLEQYRIVHFATHGLLNNHHPELSGLVLSLVDRHGKTQNGFLSLQDIYNMNLRADLVVLSACETALGKDVHGEGLMSVTRGFIYAGARRVVASLWNIDDRATAELMNEFYKAMEQGRMRPAAALRRAQIAIWKQRRWRSPYYWAAFQIQGEWQ